MTPGSRLRWLSLRPWAPPPSAFAHFGEESWVVPTTTVVGTERISIGDGVLVLELSTLAAAPGANLAIGDGTRLARGVHVSAQLEVVIEPHVSTSDYASIIDSWGPPPTVPVAAGRPPPPPARPVRIERGAYIGCSAVVGPGVTVGRGAFVGEGAVVVEDVPSMSVVYGNPAQVIRRLDPSTGWTGDRFP